MTIDQTTRRSSWTQLRIETERLVVTPWITPWEPKHQTRRTDPVVAMIETSCTWASALQNFVATPAVVVPQFVSRSFDMPECVVAGCRPVRHSCEPTFHPGEPCRVPRPNPTAAPSTIVPIGRLSILPATVVCKVIQNDEINLMRNRSVGNTILSIFIGDTHTHTK